MAKCNLLTVDEKMQIITGKINFLSILGKPTEKHLPRIFSREFPENLNCSYLSKIS